jgi:serine/threonine protein kinase
MIFDACKKGSLSDIKKDLTPNNLNNLIRFILYQLAEGLSYLKAMKVAHRDLKVYFIYIQPSNITFNSEGQLKIIDFD